MRENGARMRRLVILVSLLTMSTPGFAAAVVIDQIQPNTAAIIAEFNQDDLAQSFQPSQSPLVGAGAFVKRGGPRQVPMW